MSQLPKTPPPDMFDPKFNPFLDMFKQLSPDTQAAYKKFGEYMYDFDYVGVGIGMSTPPPLQNDDETK